MAVTDSNSIVEDQQRSRAQTTLWGRTAFLLRVIQVRLRFFLVLAAIFLVLAGWRWLQRWRDWTLTHWGGVATSNTGVSPDTEYFCPMCPGVMSNWPEKCPVCKMPLVRRQKGEAALLPEGVVARMQLSPYRLQLAGIQTAAAKYEPLERRWHAWGKVQAQSQRTAIIHSPAAGVIETTENSILWRQVKEGDLLATISGSEGQAFDIRANRTGYFSRFAVRLGDRVAAGDVLAEIVDLEVVEVLCSLSRADAAFVQQGQAVKIRADEQPSDDSVGGVVAGIEPGTVSPGGAVGVRVEVANPEGRLRPGELAQVEWHMLLADVEPFRSQPRNPPELSAGDPRDVYFCDEHPRYLYMRGGTCPFHDRELQAHTLQSNQRVEWLCPAHAEMTLRQPGKCERCGGLPMSTQVVTYSPAGQVLAIPESAVIDSGAHQTVFVESGPGMFDAVPVHAGPRTGTSISVLSGLEPGQRVVIAGAFLLDAETRLDPSLAASYFGAGPRNFSATDKPDGSTTQATDVQLAALDILDTDRARIERQQVCPVTKLPLGSMGVPVRVQTGEQLVYLCCAGCRGRVRDAVDVQAGVLEPIPAKGDEPRAGQP